ncbi:hypothetical protein GN157_11450 [Flavobacterium rakeshii]|uniref:SMEK domain-containing protein n=1 Tax=Flavobacterium rakeshii TaxID=1038845 RepID=A0A6N8HF28_9FLAO|nr:hypothetical protein [Flavobacterium rakeshii]MUV04324.1 hypothetical protein [Flavobacterium rakeshii]
MSRTNFTIIIEALSHIAIKVKLHNHLNLQDINILLENFFRDIPTTTTHVSEYTTNFELNTTLGTTEKVGMKFGGSAKSIETNSISRTLTQGNGDLGQAVVNFDDNVLIDKDTLPRFFGFSKYKIRNYSTGTVRFTFEPGKIQ